MAFDRSKFKATSVAKIAEQDKELAEVFGKRKKYTEYLRIENGENYFRIYPPHPVEDGGGEVFAEPKVVVFLPMLQEEKDEKGEVIMERGRPRMIEKKKSVFNARIHGNLSKDLVEEYIKIALKKFQEELESVQDGEEKARIEKKIEIIKGSYQKSNMGLKYNQSWVMYVDKIVDENTKQFGCLEIKTSVKNRLNDLAIMNDDAGRPIATDPFTDPDEGRAIRIIYDSNAKRSQDFYKTDFDPVNVRIYDREGKSHLTTRLFPLSDERLEEFSKEIPLAKRFRNVFSQTDFNLQLTGLEYFDRKNGLEIFNSPEFIKVIEEIGVMVPEDPENEESDEITESESTQALPIEVEDTSKDQFDLMTRKELHQWHRDNKTGVQIVPTMSDEQIREYARNFLVDMEDEEVEEQYEEEVEENYQDEVVEEQPQVEEREEVEEQPKMSTSDRIAALKKRIQK